jgi:hypothetical protein
MKMAMQKENGECLKASRSARRAWKALTLASVLTAAAALETNAAQQPEWKHFRGICDASAMEMIDDDLFLVADDEDNALRLYSRSKQGFPIATYDFSSYLGLQKKKKEIDFEGSARIGDHIFFISSHGANKKGKPQPSRHRIFAVQVVDKQARPEIRPVGYYSRLLSDMSCTPELASYKFIKASMLPPKDEGALNIEGLSATPDGHLLVGFRNPIPGGKALMLPILNPMEIIQGQRAQFGQPTQLDLNGLGIRSLTPYRDGYLIVVGAYSSEENSQLYQWDGKSPEAMLLTNGAKMPGNPEGIAVVKTAGRDVVFALSDDGTMKVGNSECKKLKDDSLKVFRAYEMPVIAHLTKN